MLRYHHIYVNFPATINGMNAYSNNILPKTIARRWTSWWWIHKNGHIIDIKWTTTFKSNAICFVRTFDNLQCTRGLSSMCAIKIRNVQMCLDSRFAHGSGFYTLPETSERNVAAGRRTRSVYINARHWCRLSVRESSDSVPFTNLARAATEWWFPACNWYFHARTTAAARYIF